MSWSGLLCGLSTFLNHGLALASLPWATRPTATLNQMHRRGPLKYPPAKVGPWAGRQQLNGAVLSTFICKPEKPNSANRKCSHVRLTTGREAVCFIPGEVHSLQEHHVMLVQGSCRQDLPGVKFTDVCSKYDCGHVQKK